MQHQVSPVISIIVTIDNEGEALGECLQSIYDQNYRNFELLIVDRGSSAPIRNFIEEIEKRSNQRIISVDALASMRSEALNKAISLARGSYLMFLNAEDTLRSDALDVLLESAVQHEGDLVYSSSMDYHFYEGKRRSRIFSAKKTLKATNVEEEPWLLRNAGFSETGKLYSKSFLDENDIRFDSSYEAFCGFVFLKQCQACSKATVADEHLLYNRLLNAEENEYDFMIGSKALGLPQAVDSVCDLYRAKGLYESVKKELFGSVKLLFTRFAFSCLNPRLSDCREQVFDMYYDYIRNHDPSWRSGLCVARAFPGLRGKCQRRVLSRKETLRSFMFGDPNRLHAALVRRTGRVRAKREDKDESREKLADFKRRVLAETGADYLFTVVVPIYNVEPYLEETLESIVCQTVGFRENIQLVLVNDGSPDGCGRICERYLRRYPENVVYVEQENAGVSAACNVGLSHARGAFVNFMGADDKWSEGTFEEAAEFFNEHPDVTLVSYRMVFFEAAGGDHILNFKYANGTQLIDIRKRFDCPQMEGGPTIMLRSAIPEDAFRGELAFQEDTKLVSSIILTSGCYGALSKSTYYYRKRLAATAATDSSTRGYEWHFNSLHGCFNELIELSEKLYGEVIPYVQFLIMYDLQWRLGYDSFVSNLSDGLKKEYTQLMVNLLRLTSDQVINTQRNISLCDKLYAMALRHGLTFEQAQSCIEVIGKNVYFLPPIATPVGEPSPMTALTSLKESTKSIIHTTELRDNTLRVMGTINCLLPIDKLKLRMGVDEKYVEIPLVQWEHTGGISSFMENNYFCFPSFDVRVPINDHQVVSFELNVAGKWVDSTPVFCRFTFLSTIKSYHYERPYLVRRTQDGLGIKIEKRELSYQEQLTLDERYTSGIPEHIMSKKLKRMRKDAIKRRHKGSSRETWIIMDHLFDARDNGRILFEYIERHPVDGVDAYFALSKRSPHFKQLEHKKNVVDRDSLRYKELFLDADKVIVSHNDEFVYRPFSHANNYMNDIENYKLVFLQHGVLLHDLSKYLRKTVSGIDAFFASSEVERENLVKGNYLYDEHDVRLAGQPRFDLIVSKEKQEKLILVMPTWRSELVLPFEDDGEERMGRRKNPQFSKSDFCRFYNDFFNDTKINATLCRNGYRMVLCLHPALTQQREDFEAGGPVSVLSEFDYADMFNKACLLITDYSSVACDFALRGKPVVYNHFDYAEYFESPDRNNESYDYQKQGFGPICEDKNVLVETVCAYIENNCVREEKYDKRVESFGFVSPGTCCANVVKAIQSLTQL
ncbi:bifunctional glycosyltransferase/CDP-glycerol:glycerophosphate glycerophosphotransferase [Raoultibacter phocaeensis]|uniref:bifunctional glycosyltransferase/CDP-glycerol:glycerophosphate glycerophosphotransferase n=1 Tax=Raoultibacter phocaeensis TaxID=2479841 RepID=UPI00111AD578|nr:glycosyltransferase [Raoultibacter phocaeensis]